MSHKIYNQHTKFLVWIGASVFETDRNKMKPKTDDFGECLIVNISLEMNKESSQIWTPIDRMEGNINILNLKYWDMTWDDQL